MMKLSATLRKATVDELAEMLAQKEKENKHDLDVKEEKGEAAETDVVKEENLKSLASPSSIFPSHAQVLVLLSKAAHSGVVYQLEKGITDVHYIATLLNPSTRNMNRFDQAEKSIAITHLEEYVADLEDGDSSSDCASSSQPPAKKAKPAFFSAICDAPVAVRSTAAVQIQEYLNAGYDPEEKLEVFWLANKLKSPLLYKTVQKIFAIMPSEAICERAFSILKSVVGDKRRRLSPESVEHVVMSKMIA
ncbi:unnamed protein product, partial [Mesorhabditis spiculigera]